MTFHSRDLRLIEVVLRGLEAALVDCFVNTVIGKRFEKTFEFQSVYIKVTKVCERTLRRLLYLTRCLVSLRKKLYA